MFKIQGAEEGCLEEVNSFIEEMLSDEIVLTFDLARCDELGINEAGDCKSKIERTGVVGPISTQEILALEQVMTETEPEYQENEETGEEFLIKEGGYDINKCAGLTTSGLKKYCEEQLNELIQEDILDEIIDSEDSSRCDELKIERLKNKCKEEFEIYTEEPEEEPEE